jgi:hypothetical protein
MQPQPRKAPFITVTGLAKSLASESACGFAGWFPAHFTYAKPPFDNVTYLLNHEALVNARVTVLREKGYQVTIEGDNGFSARGKTSGTTVAGTPDLAALQLAGRRGRIEEAKTGAPRPEHVVQTRLYLLFARWIPLFGRHLARGIKLSIDGIVTYRNGAQAFVPPPDAAFRLQVRRAIAALSGDASLLPNPSLANCTFCTVPGCASRFDPDAVTVANDLFE